MNLSLRIFFAYFLMIGLSTWIIMQNITSELVPAMRHSLEEALVDTAHLMAETVREDVVNHHIDNGRFANLINTFTQRRMDARIFNHTKQGSNLLIYITDAKGIVLYDSTGKDLGKDYSQWNDVYLTLRGKYGARSTRLDPANPDSSVMYVAAPIKDGDRIVGVLTVGKPSASVQPFFEGAVRKIENKVILLLLASLVLISLIVYWLTISIRKLTDYARSVREGKRVSVPRLGEKELAQLAEAMEDMRISLEGKDYIENYLHSLTHEIKSPLAAIQGAAELLQEDMPAEAQQQFINNIGNQSQRLHQVVEQLLKLAALEKRQQLEEIETIQPADIITQLCEDKQAMLQQKNLNLVTRLQPELYIEAERFLFQQVISNLLDNAIEFSPQQGTITLADSSNEHSWQLVITDQGPGIPDYALPRIFDRFYSLARPASGQKSTGLGLSLVNEVVQLHHGHIHVLNHDSQGTQIQLQFPRLQAR